VKIEDNIFSVGDIVRPPRTGTFGDKSGQDTQLYKIEDKDYTVAFVAPCVVGGQAFTVKEITMTKGSGFKSNEWRLVRKGLSIKIVL